MDDKGEKIIFLARELLDSGVPDLGSAKKKLGITMSFKTLCLTTFLAAASGGIVTGWIHGQDRLLNRYERTEIQALLFYASKLKGIDENALRRDVEKQVGLVNLDDMTANEFPAARLYLQEQAQ